MTLITTDQPTLTSTPSSSLTSGLTHMLEGYDCPAILVTAEYQIIATNGLYRKAFGEIDMDRTPRCFEISHGYNVPCDQAGEDCPLRAAQQSGSRERVLHIHQTPRGKEHVDVEMIPINDQQGRLAFFVELLKPVPLASGSVDEKEFVGRSPAFNRMLERVARVGPADASVLLLGESGTGKELAARAIHMASRRKDKALVTLECAGLTEALFESELFGHVKGAFTGAQANKNGLVELADGGTLFLDEIGDVPLPMQVKLLRLLETGTFRRVGSAEVQSSDFRLICATHKNLARMVDEGTFRADLYYRINVFPIYLPSLDERREDIPLLVKTLLGRIAGGKEYHVTDSAMRVLCAHPYRGNIRELRNLLNRALVFADSNIIDRHVLEECLEDDARQSLQATATSLDSSAAGKPGSTWTDLKTNERNYLEALLNAFDNDKEKVAEIAGISVRSLYRKLENL
ncbi:MAG: sigma 54-interacting transcriptional regulator [Gammaproteobacteria bacterium]